MFFLLLYSLLFGNMQNLQALEHYTLDNGLEVFLIENHTTPLMHFRIVFRTGSINEDERSNGLSHMYEHMLFDGNDLYKNENAFMAAFKSMGAAGWNGATGTEKVYYYVTVPSSKTEKAIELWAHAIMNPLLSEEELKKERPVVHNEIAGIKVRPNYIFHKKIIEALYPKYPYRKDQTGELSVIDSVTIEQLKYFKDNFYVPNNAAIIIAGDINTKNTLDLLKKYFGKWKKSSLSKKLEQHPRLTKDKWVAMDNFPSKGQISVRLIFMGPDSDRNVASTYPADIWTVMINEPDGNFKNNVYKAVPELFGEKRNIEAGYLTEREGESLFSFMLSIDNKKDMLEVIKRLVKTVDTELNKMQKDDYFSKETFESSKRQSRDTHLRAMETLEGYSQEIEFFWITTSTPYYLEYLNNLDKVSISDVRKYVKDFLQKPKLTAVWINKDDNQNIKLVERIK